MDGLRVAEPRSSKTSRLSYLVQSSQLVGSLAEADPVSRAHGCLGTAYPSIKLQSRW